MSEGAGISTTAFPTYVARDVFPATKTNECFGLGTEQMAFTAARKQQLQSSVRFLARSHFHSIPARIGDIIVCRHRVPHYGTANSGPRINSPLRSMLFAMSSRDSTSTGQDGLAVFTWQLYEWAYGQATKQHMQEIVAQKRYDPIFRLTLPQEVTRMHAALQEHGLVEAYYGAKGIPELVLLPPTYPIAAAAAAAASSAAAAALSSSSIVDEAEMEE